MHLFKWGIFLDIQLNSVRNRNIKKIIIAGFIGKLTKMAMGIKQTHVRGSHVSIEFMANLALSVLILKKLLMR